MTNTRSPIANHPVRPVVPFAERETQQSIAERFESQVALHGGRVAVKTRRHEITYAELNQRANRIARAILERRGEGSEPVGLMLEHEAPSTAAILGVLKAGKFYVPLDSANPDVRSRTILTDTETRLIAADSPSFERAKRLAPDGVAVLNTDEIGIGLSDENPSLRISPDAIAYVMFTSGSTGTPKGVIQTQRTVLHNVKRFTNSVGIWAGDRISLLASYSFAASITSFFGALLNGATLLPYPLKSAGFDQLAAWLHEEGVTIYHSVPTVFRQWASRLTAAQQCPELRLIKLGGEPINRKDVELYRKYFSDDCVLYVGLGASEMNIMTAFKMNKQTEFAGRTAPVGYAIDDTEVLLLNDQGREVSPGEIGEIAIKSAFLFQGYWRQPELTQKVLRPASESGPVRIFHTGDLGRKLADGCLFHLGRKDFQVKIRGMRVDLGEVEAALLNIGRIKEAAVIAHTEHGEQSLAAFLLADDPPPTVDEIKRHLRTTLPNT
jgi:amino acid adenylation domain-containing protein